MYVVIYSNLVSEYKYLKIIKKINLPMSLATLNISPISKPKNMRLDELPGEKLNVKPSELTRILETQKASGQLSVVDLFFGDEGALEVGKYLEDNQRFSAVELRGNNISAVGFETLCASLTNSANLNRISAEWNNIGSSNLGMIALHELLQNNTAITSIDLRNNHIGPQCAGAISNIIKDSSSLKTLDLRWNELGDEGAQLILIALQNNPNKVQVDLSGNKISQELIVSLESIANSSTTVSSQKFIERPFSNTNRRDSLQPLVLRQVERHIYTPEGNHNIRLNKEHVSSEKRVYTPERNHNLRFNKENISTENLPQERYTHNITQPQSIEKSVLRQSAVINRGPMTKENRMYQSQLPTLVATPKLRPTSSPVSKPLQPILLTNRNQQVFPQPANRPATRYNPDLDLKEIQARYEKEAKETQEKYQAHLQTHLRMLTVINDLECLIEERTARAVTTEQKAHELSQELAAEAKRRQELESHCNQLVEELQSRDQQIHEMNTHAEHFVGEGEEMRTIIENLKSDNAGIIDEYNRKIRELEAQYHHDLVELTTHNDALRSQIEKLQEDFNHQIQEMHTANEARCREYEEKIVSTTMVTQELAEEVNKRQKDIQDVQAGFNEERRRLEVIREEEYQKVQKVIKEMEEEMSGLRDENNRVVKENKRIVDDLNSLEKQRRQQQAQFEEKIKILNQEGEKLRGDLHMNTMTIERFKEEGLVNHKSMIKLEDENDNLRIEIKRVKDAHVDQIERMKRDFENERRKNDNNEKDLKRKIIDLERELRDSKDEVHRVTQEQERLGDLLKGNITKLISQTFSDYGKPGSTPNQSLNDF